MEFKLSKGPWNPLFSGDFSGHNTEILFNSDGFILSLIYDEQKGKKEGVLIQVFKVFSATGNVDEFIETLPKNSLGFTVHSKEDEEETTNKFFFLFSNVSYAVYKEETIEKELKEQFDGIQSTSKTVHDVSKSYDISINEFSSLESKQKQVFFSMPLIGLILYPALKEKGLDVPEEKKGVFVGEVFLGKTQEGKLLKEPLPLFAKTLIFSHSELERLHAGNILIEGTLLSGVNAIILDSKNDFAGLEFPSKSITDLHEFNISLEPIGFPVKKLFSSNSKISLSEITPEILIESFNFPKNELATILSKTIKESKPSSTYELIAALNRLDKGDAFTDFHKRKLIRTLLLIEFIYPDFFGKPVFTSSELLIPWKNFLGKTTIFDTSKYDKRQSNLMFNHLLNVLDSSLNSNQLKASIVVPDAKKFFPKDKKSKFYAHAMQTIYNLSNKGLGFILMADNPRDVNSDLIEQVSSKITIISEIQAAVEIKGSKQYRIQFRPCISQLK